MANWRWHAKPMGAYSMNSTEGNDNACLICSRLMLDFGWTLEACCGMLGNIAGEGGLNPWQYEISYTQALGRIPTYQEAATVVGKGMGLIGWTPCHKYTVSNNEYWSWDLSTFDGYGPNFYDRPGNQRDGNAQTELIGRCMTGAGNGNFWVRGRTDWQGNVHNVRAEDYIVMTDPSQAAIEFLWHAEYPSSIHPPQDPTQTEQRRAGWALNWYQHLIDEGFTPSHEAGPIWLLMKMSNRLKGFL